MYVILKPENHMTSILIAMFGALSALSQQNASDLDTVVQRATQYVTQYEEELGNLIGSEEYVQNAVWFNNNAGGRGYAQVGKRMQRRTSSDFLIIQVGPEWAALRKVNRLDGSKMKETEQAFEDAFDNSAAANARRLQDMKAESTLHNIGDVQRDINLPTFALKVLRKSHVQRFSFEKAGENRIEGIRTWAVRFRELRGPSLVVGGKGETLYSNGTFWIEPETGRVVKTEFMVENPFAQYKVKGRTVVTYTEGKKVKMLVPETMVEHYEAEYNTIDCTAFYTNFRPFEVEVKFEISAPREQF
jgi:hypothetical protein